MAETQEEILARKVRQLQKEVERLSAQLKEKRFGLTWIDVPEAFEQESENRIPVLEEVPQLAIHNNDGKPTHIIIEGDNYHALTCLNYTHRGKIDVIYIDPPYNTGNDGFTYKDKRFLEEYPDGTPIPRNHPLRHSTWLSFMHKRLCLAKELLKDNGVIFISIDDNELSSLKLLCDDIFPGGFLQQIIVESNPRGSQASKYFANVHEYILCYSPCKSPDLSFGIKKDESNLAEYSLEDEKGKYRLLGLRQRGGAWRRSDRPQLYYPIYVNPDDKTVSLSLDLYHTEEVLPLRPSGEESRWTWSKEKFAKNKNLLQGVKVNEGTPREKWDIYRKDYLQTDDGKQKMSKVKSIWDEKEINYQNGGAEVKEVLGEGKFAYPKPLYLIRKIIECSSNPHATILDFFAGSGTTLHATLQLNSSDDGLRQCILCQINEANICKDITYERNKRVIQGYTDSKGNPITGLGNSLKYYRTAFVGKNQPKAATDDDKLTLARKAGCLLSLAENTLYETETTDYYQMYTDERGRWTCIYFQEDYSHFEEFREKVIQLEGRAKSVYVFCWTDGAEFATEFEYERTVTVKSIPQPILDIYKSLNA